MTEWEASAISLVGTYELTDVHWSGLSLDLDGDGTSHWCLLSEYKQMPGYGDLNLFATVEVKSVEDAILSVTSFLPLPRYGKRGAAYCVKNIMCVPVVLQLSDLSHPYYHALYPCEEADSISFDNLSDLYEVSVTALDHEQMKIRVHTTLLYESADGAQEAETNYLYYTFEKKH